MATCNKEAEGKKGDERKAFMKECLSNKPAETAKQPTAAQKAQQDKMKTCNAEAKGMKGDERKKFMSDCLKRADHDVSSGQLFVLPVLVKENCNQPVARLLYLPRETLILLPLAASL